jgi:hypothetical protein
MRQIALAISHNLFRVLRQIALAISHKSRSELRQKLILLRIYY